MSKKHKKRKKSRRERKGQPVQAGADTRPIGTEQGGAESDGSAPARPPASGPAEPASAQPQQPAPRPAVTATFTPSEPAPAAGAPAAPAPAESAEAAEYTAVRKDLRKLGLTILACVAVVAGLVVLNDRTGFVGALGEQLFHLWE